MYLFLLFYKDRSNSHELCSFVFFTTTSNVTLFLADNATDAACISSLAYGIITLATAQFAIIKSIKLIIKLLLIFFIFYTFNKLFKLI